MKSESTFGNNKTLILWIKSSCITIDYEGVNGFLEDLTYMSSFLIHQMRNFGLCTSPALETGIIFMLRSASDTIQCVNTQKPMDGLEKVAIALPESKDFIILNGIELDNPCTCRKLKNFAFLPSGLIHILPKPTRFLPPSSTLTWDDFWMTIKSNTMPSTRRLFCASFATQLCGNTDDEENLKTLLNPPGLNKKALFNLLDSAMSIPCVDEELCTKWATKPDPDRLETAEWNLNRSFANKKVLPGHCSLIFNWKGRNTLCKRNYHVDPREESKDYTVHKRFTSDVFLKASTLEKLSPTDACQNINEPPTQVIETTARRLSQREKAAVNHLLYRRYKNHEYWNPAIHLADISDGLLARIWASSYNCFKQKNNDSVSRRGFNLLETIELISMIEINVGLNSHANESSDNLIRPQGLNDDKKLKEWHGNLLSILKTNIAASSDKDNDFLKRAASQGASYLSVISRLEKLAQLVPLHKLKKGPGYTNNTTSPAWAEYRRAQWLISNLTSRMDSIWNKTDCHQIGNTCFQSKPRGNFSCESSSLYCPAEIFSWFSNNQSISLLLCKEHCQPIHTNDPPTHSHSISSTTDELPEKSANPEQGADGSRIRTQCKRPRIS